MARSSALVTVLSGIAVVQTVVVANLIWSVPAREAHAPQVADTLPSSDPASSQPASSQPVPAITPEPVSAVPVAVDRAPVAAGSAAAGAAAPTMPAGQAAAAAAAAGASGDAGTRSIAPKIGLPPEIRLADAGPRPVGISIEPAGSAPAGSWLGIVGLEAPFRLSAGTAGPHASWRVPLSDVAGLTVSVDPGSKAETFVSVGLVSESGDVLATGRMLLIAEAPARSPEIPPKAEPEPARVAAIPEIASAPAAGDVGPVSQPQVPSADPIAATEPSGQLEEPATSPPQPVTTETASPPAPPEPRPAEPAAVASLDAVPAARPQHTADVAHPAPAPEVHPAPRAIDTAALTRLVSLGEQEMARGNVAAARQFFRRAADSGLAEAALLMGDTFATGRLARIGAVGVQADNAEAQRWYARAHELGAGAAALERLEQLAAR